MNTKRDDFRALQVEVSPSLLAFLPGYQELECSSQINPELSPTSAKPTRDTIRFSHDVDCKSGPRLCPRTRQR